MARPALLVSVGTDHHRFDRLISWTDNWVGSLGIPIDYTVQHGTSAPSASATNFPMVSRPVLLDLVRSSTIVVTQGGPGSIVDARSCGHIPIVVPRVHRHDEVVDDHQVAFCALMSSQGACLVATDEPTLHAWLDYAIAWPERLRCAVPDSPAAATARAIRRQLLRVARRPSGWVDPGRIRQVWRPPRGVILESAWVPAPALFAASPVERIVEIADVGAAEGADSVAAHCAPVRRTSRAVDGLPSRTTGEAS